MTIRLFAFVACLLGLVACDDGMPVTLFQNDQLAYTVSFEDNPGLEDMQVYSKGFSIGKVVGQSLNTANEVELQIEIKRQFANFMMDNVVFYMDQGRLTYSQLWTEGKPITEGTVINGYASKSLMEMHKTTDKVGRAAGAIKNKAGELIDGIKQTFSSDEKSPVAPVSEPSSSE
jgi:hypothetical protein